MATLPKGKPKSVGITAHFNHLQIDAHSYKNRLKSCKGSWSLGAKKNAKFKF